MHFKDEFPRKSRCFDVTSKCRQVRGFCGEQGKVAQKLWS